MVDDIFTPFNTRKCQSFRCNILIKISRKFTEKLFGGFNPRFLMKIIADGVEFVLKIYRIS